MDWEMFSKDKIGPWLLGKYFFGESEYESFKESWIISNELYS